MKILIIVTSTYTGATLKVANAMSEELKATVMTPEEVTDLSSYDLIGFGSGIRFGSFDNRIMSFVRNASIDGKKIFIFTTRCRPILGGYHKELKTLIKEKKGDLIGEFSCKGFDRTGPWVAIDGYNKGRPNAKDLFKAKLFANKIKRKAHPLADFCKQPITLTNSDGIKIRTNEGVNILGDMVMLNTASCIKCGKCLAICPLGVYKIEKDSKEIFPVDEINCTMCKQCENNCPTNSIYINESIRHGFHILLRESKLQKIYKARR